MQTCDSPQNATGVFNYISPKSRDIFSHSGSAAFLRGLILCLSSGGLFLKGLLCDHSKAVTAAPRQPPLPHPQQHSIRPRRQVAGVHGSGCVGELWGYRQCGGGACGYRGGGLCMGVFCCECARCIGVNVCERAYPPSPANSACL